MSDNININVTENIDQVNIVASEVVEVVDLNLYATTEDVTINVTEEIIQVNINKVSGSNVTKTSDLINDGADGINPFITLEDIPPVTGFVPYTGATQNVDLGEYEIKAGQVEFDQTPTGAAGVGVMRWNNTDGTLDLGLKGGNVTLQLGQEQVARVVNKTATNITLLESNYQVVKIIGATGQRLSVDLAQANNDLNSATTLGVVTETIANNQEGFITTGGQVKEINTTGSLQGETWADGDVLYLSPTTAGKITNIKPTAPNHTIIVGYVEYAHAIHGKIFVKVDNGYELEELHNVTSTNYTTPIDTDSVLTYDVTNSLWKRLSWSNIKSNLKTYFDGIYESLSNKSTSTSLGTSDTLYPTQNAVKTYVDGKVTDTIVDGVTTIAPSQNAVFDALTAKQDSLVSGTNIKTINGNSVLGSGNLTVSESFKLDIDDFFGYISSANGFAGRFSVNPTFSGTGQQKYYGSVRMTQLTSASTLGSFVRMIENFNTPNIVVESVFSIGSVLTPLTSRICCGFYSPSWSGNNNQNPSTWSFLGINNDSGEENLKLTYSTAANNSSPKTHIDLGSNFPARFSNLQNVYLCRFYLFGNTARVTVKNLVNGAYFDSGIINSQGGSLFVAHMNNNSTAESVSMCTSGVIGRRFYDGI